jgi:putative SOS response-associated peptidase YedK
MCGRVLQITPPDQLAHAYSVSRFMILVKNSQPRYNLAPSQSVTALRLNPEGQRELVTFTWGLIPHWAKKPNAAYSLINARAETVAEKPAFRDAFKLRRCLIPVDGFYEWQQVPGGKQPYCIRSKAGRPLSFAGLWEKRQDGRQALGTCAIIVTSANEFMQPIHDRMPVMLAPAAFEAWLDPRTEPASLSLLLNAAPEEALEAFPVSRRVNRTENDDAKLLDPV